MTQSVDSSLETQAPPSLALLEPRALAAMTRVSLVAKQVMDGYIQGMHRSPHIGFALDFAQHRQYVPGDDVKRIDWRVYAKADRYYIKQYEVTTNLHAHVVLDCSGSMGYQGEGDALSKFRYAQFCAACLAYLVLHQQDSFGLVTFDSAVREFLPARSAPNHLMTVTEKLDAARTGGEGKLAPVLHEIAERIGKRGMVIILSDLFDDAGEMVEALHHLRHKRHEVVVLQVMAKDELEFPFRKFSEFQSLERRGQLVRLDPATMRAQYLENVRRHLKAVADGCAKLQIQHELLNTSIHFEKALTTYLAKRMGSR